MVINSKLVGKVGLLVGERMLQEGIDPFCLVVNREQN